MLARTNVIIDTDLLDEAGRLTGIKTKKDVIVCALQELIKQRSRKRLLAIRHAGLWQGDLNELRASRHDLA
ncbi:MAG TPA: type II toxin-antitoxin system VapB family antitoxin [Desulfuromonadales bacterium]|nr:type II toxin-antitoxin system VapB family antitoxin [Desulfuromonadales bacterium]